MGLLIGIILFHALSLADIPEKYFVSISSIVVGIIAGLRFRFIYGNEGTGMLLGGVLGFALSYYFLEGLNISFLTTWLSHDSIISSGVVSGIIGLFTGIFEMDFRIRQAEDERMLTSLIEPQIEAYELAVAQLKNAGFDVKSTSIEEHFAIGALKTRLSEEQISKLSQEQIEEIQTKFSSGFWWSILKIQLMKKSQLPLSSYKVYDSSGKKVHSFSSISALVKFSESISK